MCAAHSRKQRRNEPRRRFWETQRKGGRDKREREERRGEERRVVEKRSQREREFLCRVCLFFFSSSPSFPVLTPSFLSSRLRLSLVSSFSSLQPAASVEDVQKAGENRVTLIVRDLCHFVACIPPHLPVLSRLSGSAGGNPPVYQNRLFLVDP